MNQRAARGWEGDAEGIRKGEGGKMIFIVIVLIIVMFVSFVFYNGPDMIEEFRDQIEEWKKVLGKDKNEDHGR